MATGDEPSTPASDLLISPDAQPTWSSHAGSVAPAFETSPPSAEVILLTMDTARVNGMPRSCGALEVKRRFAYPGYQRRDRAPGRIGRGASLGPRVACRAHLPDDLGQAPQAAANWFSTCAEEVWMGVGRL